MRRNDRIVDFWKRLACLCFAAGLVVSVASSAQAQSPQAAQDVISNLSATLSSEHATFSDALNALHSQTGLTYMADGLPIKSEVNIRVSGKLPFVLKSVGQLFGYTWTVSKRNVVLFRKTFEDAADTPQLNLLEWTAMARDIDQILSRITVPQRPDDYAKAAGRLYASLSPMQLAQMQNNKTLLCSDMTESQLALVTAVNTVNKFWGDQLDWRAFHTFLAALPASYLRIEESSMSNSRPGVSKPTGNSRSLLLYVPQPNRPLLPMLIWQESSAVPDSKAKVEKAGGSKP